MVKNSFIKILLFIVLSGGSGILYGQTYLTASLNTPGGSGILSENCAGPYELVIRRGPDNDSSTFVVLSGAGTATIGVDYEFPSGAFPFEMQPEDTMVVIPITVFNDGIPEGTESIQWEIAFLAGEFSDFITFETSIVDEYEVTIEVPQDTIPWCRDIPYVLLATSDAEEIFWTPAAFFDDSLGPAATVRPFSSGWFYASVGSASCGASDSVYFDLAIVDITNADTVFICLGDQVNLTATLEGTTEFVWIPSDTTLSNPNILNPIADPVVTTTYILKSDIGVCTASDRVVVQVDSIPYDTHIAIAPEKPYYCAGEVVALFSPSFDTLAFPNITFMWGPPDQGATFESDLDVYNAALTLLDTTWYFRDNINNACRSRDSILINVVPPSVPLSVTDTTLCPGEMFQVQVLSQVSDPEWNPSEGLSCTACLNPTVTVIGSPGQLLFYEFSGKILECPVGAGLTIHIPPTQNIQISGDNVVCTGEIIPLTINNPAGLSDFEWSIDEGNVTLSCTDCPNPQVTINTAGNITLIVTAETTNPAFCGAVGVFQFSAGASDVIPTDVFIACLGESVDVFVSDPTVSDITWSVNSGDVNLSCINCEVTTATINSDDILLSFVGETTDPDFCNAVGFVRVETFEEDDAMILLDSLVGQGAQTTAMLVVQPLPNAVTWNINGVDISATSTSITFNADEEMNVIIATFINSSGCEESDTVILITVPPSFDIPNAFTPNNDGKNDNFRIIVKGNIVVEQFLIFNRWGQLVYEGPENDLEGWDGVFGNEPAASDTYVYTARIRYPNGREEIAKGDVMLLR